MPSALNSRCFGSGTKAVEETFETRFSHGSEGHCRQITKHRRISVKPHSNRLRMAAGMLSLAVAAMLLHGGVEGSKARRVWHRREEVGPRVFDQPLDLAFVVPLAGAAEAIAEQVVAAQFGEGPRACPLAVTQNARHRDLQIVIQDRQR